MEFFQFFKNVETTRKVSKSYWFKVAERLYKESGEIPDPLQIRAAIIIDALGIPSGPYSALEISKARNKLNIEKDRIIAKYLTNKAGVLIGKKGAVSLDFRDLYPEGLPEELKKVLSPEALSIIDAEYKHAKVAKRKFEKTRNIFEVDLPIHYFRLPGGIDLFMKGYMHNPGWHKKHQKFLKTINTNAKVIAIEGSTSIPYGESLNFYWNPQITKGVPIIIGHYDLLMHQAVEAGFSGLFTEIDARDISKIQMDVTPFYDPSSNLPPNIPLLVFPKLPNDFFVKYFEYLQREHPNLTKIVESPKKLKKLLITQSTTQEKRSLLRRLKGFFYKGKLYIYHPYITKKGKTSLEPTFLELGQKLFSDALAAIKLHLIAKLMADGHIEKGPIVDYEGAFHLSSKSFFLKYPQYAMLVVLRTINELMAGRVENLEGIKKVFQNPNWPEIIREITRLVFKKVEGNELKNVEIDFLKTYGIDLQKIMPSDEEIKEIQERLKKALSMETKND